MSRLSSRRRVKALGHIVNFTHLQLMTKNELVATMPLHGFKVVHATRYSEFSYRGEEYVRRFIPNGVIASALGRMLDQHWCRWSTIGCNKTFLVGEKTDS